MKISHEKPPIYDALVESFGINGREREEVPGENLMEKLAYIEHQRWADWQAYLFSVCDQNQNGSFTIPSFFVKQWERQIKTPYTALSEKEKESNRDQVKRYLYLINPMRNI